MGRGCGCARKKRKRIREISFRTTTLRFHWSYTSRWIPIQLAGLYLVLSPFQWRAGRTLLIGAAKSMLERTTKGLMIGCVHASLPRVNRLREKAKRNLRFARLGIGRLVKANYFSRMISYMPNKNFLQKNAFVGKRDAILLNLIRESLTQYARE